MTRLTVRAVLFDMDGTLVDSTAMVETVWTEFSAANGADAAAVIDFAHGRPSRDTIARFAADATRIDEWNEWITKAEGERFNEVTAIPGARGRCPFPAVGQLGRCHVRTSRARPSRV